MRSEARFKVNDRVQLVSEEEPPVRYIVTKVYQVGADGLLDGAAVGREASEEGGKWLYDLKQDGGPDELRGISEKELKGSLG